MHSSRVSFLLRSVLVAAAVVMGWVTLSSPALAFGTFNLKQTSVEEADGRWKFNVEVDYGSKPHLGHVPFDFVLVQKVYYEYSITDTDKAPVQRRKPMHNQEPQREQMDIAFADARGDLWQRTKFSFALRRDRGFSAGEYSLTVKRSSDGAVLGRPMNITLNGQNELIDRRAIVFAGEPKKKPDAKPASTGKPEGAKPEEAAEEPTDTVPEDVEPPDSEEAAAPPPVDKKAKGAGCGCRAVGNDGTSGLASALGVLLLGLTVWSRRRRRANVTP